MNEPYWLNKGLDKSITKITFLGVKQTKNPFFLENRYAVKRSKPTIPVIFTYKPTHHARLPVKPFDITSLTRRNFKPGKNPGITIPQDVLTKRRINPKTYTSGSWIKLQDYVKPYKQKIKLEDDVIIIPKRRHTPPKPAKIIKVEQPRTYDPPKQTQKQVKNYEADIKEFENPLDFVKFTPASSIVIVPSIKQESDSYHCKLKLNQTDSSLTHTNQCMAMAITALAYGKLTNMTCPQAKDPEFLANIIKDGDCIYGDILKKVNLPSGSYLSLDDLSSVKTITLRHADIKVVHACSSWDYITRPLTKLSDETNNSEIKVKIKLKEIITGINEENKKLSYLPDNTYGLYLSQCLALALFKVGGYFFVFDSHSNGGFAYSNNFDEIHDYFKLFNPKIQFDYGVWDLDFE